MDGKMRPLHLSNWTAAICSILLLFSANLPAFCSTTEKLPNTSAASVAQTTALDPAVPIALSDVVAKAKAEQTLIDRANQLAAHDPVVALSRTLDALDASVGAKEHLMTGVHMRELPVMRLESLARHWQLDAWRYERWASQSNEAFAPFSDTAVELAQHRTAWAATRATGVLDNLPPIMSQHVDDIVRRIDASEGALGIALTRHFALEKRGTELAARIREGQRMVNAGIDDIDRRLLSIDAPPLWRMVKIPAHAPAVMDSMELGLQIEQQFAIDYHATRHGNQQALRGLQLLLLPLILWLFLRSQRGAGRYPAPGDATRALRRPFSVWLLLAILAVVVLEPDAPLLVHEIALLLAIIPVIRLMPAGMLVSLGIWPYIAIALYGLERLCVAMVTDTGWSRWLMLLLDGAVIVLTCRMLIDQRLVLLATSRPGLWRTVRMVARTVLALLLVAVAANVVGNTSLAETLTSGVVDSGYMALLLYAGVNACLGIVRAFLYQPELDGRRLVHQHRAMIERECQRLLIIGAVLGWAVYSADRFRIQRPLSSLGKDVMQLGIEAGEISIHLGDLVIFAVAIWIAFVLAKGIRGLLREELPGHNALPRGVGNSIASLSYYGVLAVGGMVALSAAGLKLSQFALVFGALGVGIGFGLQNVVNNFVSGLVLMFERPAQPGDIIDANGTSGTVREIRLRSTTIRTSDGADVVVPNGMLLSGNLTNWTMHDLYRRIEVSVDVARTSDPLQVIRVLEAATQSTSGVSSQPSPSILLADISETGLKFTVRVWTHDINCALDVRSCLLEQILTSLDEARIEIPFPQVDVNVREHRAVDGGEV